MKLRNQDKHVDLIIIINMEDQILEHLQQLLLINLINLL